MPLNPIPPPDEEELSPCVGERYIDILHDHLTEESATWPPVHPA